MNNWSGLGRTTKEIESSQSGKMAYTSIAIDRPMKDKDGNKVTDFISLRFLGEKPVNHAKQYITKGLKIWVTGSICIDNYKDKEGNNKQSVYVAVRDWGFAESKSASQNNNPGTQPSNASSDGFMNLSDSVDDKDLPFN